MSKGSIIRNGTRSYTIARVTRSKEYQGERLYWLMGHYGITFGPYTIETLSRYGYSA